MAFFFALLSAVAWSLANVSIRRTSERLGDARALVGTIAVGATILIVAARIDAPFPSLNRAITAMIGLSASAALLAYGGLFTALRRGAVTVVAPIVSSWCLVSVTYAIIVQNETPSARTWVGIVIVFVGNVLVCRGDREPDNGQNSPRRTRRLVLVTAGASSLGFGLLAPALASLETHVGPLYAPALTWITAWPVTVGFLWFARRYDVVRGEDEKWVGRFARAAEFLRLVFPPAIFETIGLLAITLAVARAPLTTVTPISSLSTGLTVIAGLVLLGERPRRTILIGAVLVSLGITLV